MSLKYCLDGTHRARANVCIARNVCVALNFTLGVLIGAAPADRNLSQKAPFSIDGT